ncbi:MAG: cobalamin-dependent protein [Desulfuromonadaceae bacterium]
MNILLINPPNCGRSIPEERYGITTIKQIFRGEPLALETLAGNLPEHEVKILDLKVEPQALEGVLADFAPDLIGLTAVTCEANSVLALAERIKQAGKATVVVGGIHASCDPEFFNRKEIDYIVIGLGKQSFRELVQTLVRGDGATADIPGVCRTSPGRKLRWRPRRYDLTDLVAEQPPRYDLVAGYRAHYTLAALGAPLGFVSSAFGCPYSCSFCSIGKLTDGRYLSQSAERVVRDIRLLGEIPVIRLVDANTFGNPDHARRLCRTILAAELQKNFIIDIRSDSVVQQKPLPIRA